METPDYNHHQTCLVSIPQSVCQYFEKDSFPYLYMSWILWKKFTPLSAWHEYYERNSLPYLYMSWILGKNSFPYLYMPWTLWKKFTPLFLCVMNTIKETHSPVCTCHEYCERNSKIYVFSAGTYCTWDGVNPDSIDIVLQINENNDTFVYNHPNGTASDELVK